MAKKDPVVDPNSVNMIVKSTLFKGDFTSESVIKFDGKLEGNLTTKSKLVLGIDGEIKGEIRCKNAFISGRVIGKIFVDETITLQSSAFIEGEITTSKIAIEPGAVFNGTCRMNGNELNNKVEK